MQKISISDFFKKYVEPKLAEYPSCKRNPFLLDIIQNVHSVAEYGWKEHILSLKIIPN